MGHWSLRDREGEMGIFRRSKLTDRRDTFIDLRDAPPVRRAPTTTREVWARSNRCPRCGGVGYLDHVDVNRRVMFQHCTECHHAWETTEASCVQPR